MYELLTNQSIVKNGATANRKCRNNFLCECTLYCVFLFTFTFIFVHMHWMLMTRGVVQEGWGGREILIRKLTFVLFHMVKKHSIDSNDGLRQCINAVADRIAYRQCHWRVDAIASVTEKVRVLFMFSSFTLCFSSLISYTTTFYDIHEDNRI